MANGLLTDLVTLPESDEVIAYVAYADQLWIFIGLMMIFVLLFVLWNYAPLILQTHLRPLAFLVFAAVAMASVLYQGRNYTRIGDDGITYVKGGQSFHYQKEDVKEFHIYTEDESLKMRLTFDDGRQTEVLTDIISNTDAWGERYYNPETFAASLAGELIESGAKAKIEDVSGLKEEGTSDELRKGYEQIMRYRGEISQYH